MDSKVTISFVALVVLVLIPVLYAKRGDEAKYTRQEEQALVKLRKLVSKDLYKDYMHRDEYLIPWLRTRKLDAGKAAELLKANLKWRKDENIDGILTETFPQFKGFYSDIDGHDKEGRPLVLMPYSLWDTRKAALAGQMDLLTRYMIKNIFEGGQVVAREQGQADGTNATQFDLLVELGGYNLRQHACVRCLQFYTDFIINYEAHYPQAFYKLLSINTPAIFDQVLTIVRPFFSDYFGKSIAMHGLNKDEWRSKITKYLALDQIPTRFGGDNPKKIQ